MSCHDTCVCFSFGDLHWTVSAYAPSVLGGTCKKTGLRDPNVTVAWFDFTTSSRSIWILPCFASFIMRSFNTIRVSQVKDSTTFRMLHLLSMMHHMHIGQCKLRDKWRNLPQWHHYLSNNFQKNISLRLFFQTPLCFPTCCTLWIIF